MAAPGTGADQATSPQPGAIECTLPELVAAHAAAHAAEDALQARTLAAEFGRRFYGRVSLAEPAAFGPETQLGAAFRLVREVAEALGEERTAHEAAMNWMVWASDNNDVPEYWRARARLAADEATRYVRFLSDGPTNPAAETEIPLIARMAREIVGYRDLLLAEQATNKHADKRAALIDAALRVEKALMSVHRPDLAEELQRLIRRLPEVRHSEALNLRLTLMEAALLHSKGQVVQAARLCAAQLSTVGDSAMVASLKLREKLAAYSVETGNHDTALRMLSNNFLVARRCELDLELLLVAGQLADIQWEPPAGNRNTEDIFTLARTAVDVAERYPDCATTMAVRLLAAQQYFDAGKFGHALDIAEPVAAWSNGTDNAQRTDMAFSLAADAAVQLGDVHHAARLYQALAEVRWNHPAAITAAETLMDVALNLSEAGAEPGLSEELVQAARAFITDCWQEAKWYETQALLRWAIWDNQGVVDFAERAAELFLNSHAPWDAAQVLAVAARAAVSAGDMERGRDYTDRVEKLVSAEHPLREELMQLLAEADPGPAPTA